ncbi:hypothetical protein EXW84_21355 [Klebsiella pneumoniae]|nr:hypothetical protein [Klebsiella pneumoniae]MDN6914187.1 hypothetical protein [Klebsiella pneumoniae]MDO8027090.1 hypothetical protein [Enterococcus faecium]
MASITLSAAELLLHRLQALDVAYIFINSGTDYPPVIEAWAKARATGQKVPELGKVRISRSFLPKLTR